MTSDVNDNQTTNSEQIELLRLSKVCQRVGLSKSTIYQLIKEDKFPAQVKISVRAVAWRSADVINWIHDCQCANSK